MEFKVTSDNKWKARRRRMIHERKWKVYRILTVVSMIVSICSFSIGIFVLDYEDEAKNNVCAMLFAVCLVVSVGSGALMANFCSHWIQDRLNEHLWIEDGKIYHFLQIAFASGLNYRNTDSRGYLFSYDIKSIYNIKYDEKSKRIEFKAYGRGTHFVDISKKLVDHEWDINENHTAIFYDYYEPSLKECLIEKGLKVQYVELNNYSIRDNRV